MIPSNVNLHPKFKRRAFLRTAALAPSASVLGMPGLAVSAESQQDHPLTHSEPRVDLAHLPTPLEELPRLTKLLGGPRLLVKRDDQTGLALGGNKVRKLEFLVAHAIAEGADTLVTSGSIQSNHCRQTAAAAARIGLRCVLLLGGKNPGGMSEGNLLLDRLLGAEVRIGEQTLEDAAKTLRAAGKKPYVIPIGGSNAVGATGYVAAMEELSDQLKQRSDNVDWIVVPTGSGGTQSGLAVGARSLGFAGKILGIGVGEPVDETKQRLTPIANATARHLNLSERFKPGDFEVNSDFLGGGYGVMGDLERKTIRTVAETEGLLLDPVYTGRAFGGLVELTKKGFFRKEETVLFWHTGGIPELFVPEYAGSLL